MQPIWKDLILTAAGDSAEYAVLLDGAVVYTGKAYRRPGAAAVEFTVNSIAADYLRNAFPVLPDPSADSYGEQTNGAARRFVVSTAGGTTAVTFVNDWSFEDVTDDQWRQLLQIFDEVDARLPLVFSRCGSDPVNVVRVTTEPASITTGPLTWTVGASTCYRYALYFLNAFGGWSFIYLEAVKAAEDYARKTAKRFYHTNDAAARGAVNYVNEVTRRWTAKTPYLTDDQAAKIWHLAGTTAAVLYDMQTGEALPVNVTAGGWEEQTYRNRGAKRPRYDLEFTLAQDRLRR